MYTDVELICRFAQIPQMVGSFLNYCHIAVLHQLDPKIIYPHYDFKHLTEKDFEIEYICLQGSAYYDLRKDEHIIDLAIKMSMKGMREESIANVWG